MTLAPPERPARPRVGRVGRAACLLALAAAAAGACSQIVTSDSTAQCTSNQECVARGGAFAQSVCGPQGVCVSAGGPDSVTCQDNATCVAAKGQNWVCRRSDQLCVSLTSAECALVDGDAAAEDALYVGSILPTTGALADAVGKPIENAVRMAFDDFATSGGLPVLGTGRSRQVVLIGCSDGNDPATAVLAATHLKGLGVQVIIGSFSTESTLAVANAITIMSDIMLLSPAATGVELTALNDFGFVWRTAPSDASHATALSALVAFLEPELLQRLPPPAPPLKVANLYRTDNYGRVIKSGFESEATFNGRGALANGQNYVPVPFGNPGDPGGADPPKYQIASEQVVAARPHLVLIAGREEAADLVRLVEQQWPSGVEAPPRPYYLLTEGITNEALPSVVNNPDLRRRVFGTVLGSNSAEFSAYRLNYLAKYPQPFHPFAANAYDAAYMVAYSAVAAGSDPIVGQDFVNSFAKLTPRDGAPVVLAGPTGIDDAFNAFSGGNTIDFNGTSGPLNFNTQAGEALADLQVYCAVTGRRAAPSGLYFEASSRTLKGAINPEVCL
ncbi:MAG TPA: ABC transporter substrate-binding protein [Polyangiaceae bacterium]|nr:ABC transporter substrate-binding protein [Polyangiaceae bacterium]